MKRTMEVFLVWGWIWQGGLFVLFLLWFGFYGIFSGFLGGGFFGVCFFFKSDFLTQLSLVKWVLIKCPYFSVRAKRFQYKHIFLILRVEFPKLQAGNWSGLIWLLHQIYLVAFHFAWCRLMAPRKGMPSWLIWYFWCVRDNLDRELMSSYFHPSALTDISLGS